MQKIKVFICYSTKNKKFADPLRDIMDQCYGFEVFLAPDSITISEDSIEQILRNLSICDIFVPLVSTSLQQSSFANQEIGFAVAKKRKIVPISLDGLDPYCLFYNKHAHKCEDLNQDPFAILKAATEIFLLTVRLKKFEHLKERAIHNLISVFINSSNFRITSASFFVMKQTKKEVKFTPNQLQDIKKALKSNPQICNATKLYPIISKFFSDEYRIH